MRIDCKPWGYSVDDIKLAIREAAAGGLKVEGHGQTPEGAHRAIDREGGVLMPEKFSHPNARGRRADDGRGRRPMERTGLRGCPSSGYLCPVYCSPASIRIGSRFCFGGSGQVANSVTAHGGFSALLKSRTTCPFCGIGA